jgi:hypothetical protein
MFAAISDDGLEDNLNTKLVKLFGEIERIRVLAKRSQQLRTYCDDFCVHDTSVNESPEMLERRANNYSVISR